MTRPLSTPGTLHEDMHAQACRPDPVPGYPRPFTRTPALSTISLAQEWPDPYYWYIMLVE
jgi:hypothetical protein